MRMCQVVSAHVQVLSEHPQGFCPAPGPCALQFISYR